MASTSRGDYRVMDKSSEVLQKANRAVCAAYAAKTGKEEPELLKLMDRETWFTAQEAVEAGLVDAVSKETQRLVASGPGVLPHEAIERIKATVKHPFRAAEHRIAQASLDFLRLRGDMK